MKIEFDNAKNEANLAKHGVDLASAAAFEFDTAIFWVDTRKDYGETRNVAIGYIAGRLHVLIFSKRGQTVRAISLRKANKREERGYHGKA